MNNVEKLALAYTPGVAEPCKEIEKNPEQAYELTNKWNTVAIFTDGSRVLGLGNVGPLAAIPVMEGKAMLFKELGNIDAFPICVAEQDHDKLIMIAKAIAPVFGGINLEDIENPKCFFVERRLIREIDIPVFHDDQHGTAIVTLAGMINALKVAGKEKDARIVVNGVGAAGTAIIKLLLQYGYKNIIACDSKGIIAGTRNDLTDHKWEIAARTNPENIEGNVDVAAKGADVIISVAKANVLTEKTIAGMNSKPVVFALSNPIPDIDPNVAEKMGVYVIATGRSDYPNQINNVLAFPGVFRGALDVRASAISDEMKLAAAKAIAELVKEPSTKNIVPPGLDKKVPYAVACAVAEKAIEQGLNKLKTTKKEAHIIIKTNLLFNKVKYNV